MTLKLFLNHEASSTKTLEFALEENLHNLHIFLPVCMAVRESHGMHLAHALLFQLYIFILQIE